ncbi:MAG: glycoside hydrolase family 1 protein, partial [Steroidobacteraceae bacterium]
GQWDGEALEHYRQVIRALRVRNIEPVVTLHHFSSPAWFSREGGWLRRDAALLFERYVARVADAFGSEVQFWISINEPTVYVLQGFINGLWPPFESGRPLNAGRVLLRLAAAHRKAYRTIKARRPGARVGFAHHALLVEPCDASRTADRFVARVRDFFLNRLFFRLIGAASDFIGLNYYTRCCVKGDAWRRGRLFGRICVMEHHPDQGAKSAMGWEIYPRGLGVVLSEFARYGLPLFITENGIATDDDRLRCSFLDDHLREAANAMRGGIELLGYLHWTLMDNFEWHLGMAPKFGLAAVDMQTGRRIPRPSAEHFSRLCRDAAFHDGGL